MQRTADVGLPIGGEAARRPAKQVIGLSIAPLVAVGVYLLWRQGFVWEPRPGPSQPVAWGWLFLLSFVPYAFALIALQRRVIPGRWVALLTAAMWLPFALSGPAQSHDLYQYVIYARLQLAHHVDPYVVAPISWRSDPWVHFGNWPDQVSVYGPLWSRSIAAGVWLAGSNFGLAVTAAKALAIACGAGAAATLRRLRPEPGGTWLVAAFCWNPLILSSVVLGAHADAAMALGFALAALLWAMGRLGASTFVMGLCCLIKAYAVAPAVIIAAAAWRRGHRREAMGGIAGVAVVAILTSVGYDGVAMVRNLVGIERFTSSGPFSVAVAAIGEGLEGLDARRPDALSVHLVHILALTLAVWGMALLIRSPRTPTEPWRAATLALGLFLIVSPWWLPWYEVGLLTLGLAAGGAVQAASLTTTGTAFAVTGALSGVVDVFLRAVVPTGILLWMGRNDLADREVGLEQE